MAFPCLTLAGAKVAGWAVVVVVEPPRWWPNAGVAALPVEAAGVLAVSAELDGPFAHFFRREKKPPESSAWAGVGCAAGVPVRVVPTLGRRRCRVAAFAGSLRSAERVVPVFATPEFPVAGFPLKVRLLPVRPCPCGASLPEPPCIAS